MVRIKIVVIFLMFGAMSSLGQVLVTISPPRVTGSKAVVPLAMKNGFAEKVESARAVCFLLDEYGKMVGQSTKWVIGGSKDKPGLDVGATNAFNFVITASEPFTTTNLTAKVQFNRIILEGGKLADLNKGPMTKP